MGAAMVRVGAQLDEVVFSHLVDDALNVEIEGENDVVARRRRLTDRHAVLVLR